MSSLDHLFTPHALTEALEMGHVRTQTHPELPLTIYNYTETCAFAGAWTPVTLACRGLIASADGALVARPLGKFFNYSQTGAPIVSMDEPVTVTDKADGSDQAPLARTRYQTGPVRSSRALVTPRSALP